MGSPPAAAGRCQPEGRRKFIPVFCTRSKSFHLHICSRSVDREEKVPEAIVYGWSSTKVCLSGHGIVGEHLQDLFTEKW